MVVVGIDIKSQSIKVFIELLDHSPLKGEKLQFVAGIMGLSLCQTATGIGDDSIGPIMMSLVEDSPQARPTCIAVQFKRLSKISIGKNGCCGAQTLQVVEGLPAPVVQSDAHPQFACIFS